MWAPGTDLTTPSLLKKFITKADSIIGVYDCSSDVEKYLKLWSYLNAYDNYASVPRILQVKSTEMPYQRKDFLPEPHQVLDTPLAALFTNTPHIVFTSLPNQNNLDSALIYLETHYTDSTLKAQVKNNIAERYVTRFNYADGFEKGLERLQKATEKYGLDPSHAERFAKLKATIPGQPFPENVVLKDKDGNTVDFSTFRGKYVYIDMWASWCGPCNQEIPYLKELEKTLGNDQVVFVSISIDEDPDAWKAAIKRHNLTGNQFLGNETLATLLKVQGIPRFLIYDKEGRLLYPEAPRPSSGMTIRRILNSLK
jgi:thiol-disulfide isomerase/thioredoxin